MIENTFPLNYFLKKSPTQSIVMPEILQRVDSSFRLVNKKAHQHYYAWLENNWKAFLLANKQIKTTYFADHNPRYLTYKVIMQNLRPIIEMNKGYKVTEGDSTLTIMGSSAQYSLQNLPFKNPTIKKISLNHNRITPEWLLSVWKEQLKDNQVSFWNTVQENIPNATKLETAEQIRPFFDDPKNQETLQKITRIELFDESLLELPKQILFLKNLEYLGLQQNELTSIPPELAQLEKLKKLDLTDNKKLRELPKEILERQASGRLEIIGYTTVSTKRSNL